MPARPREQLEPAVLDRVRVLELVDEHVLEPVAVLAQQMLVVAQKLEAAQQQLAEIDEARGRARLLVARVEVDHLPPARVAFVVQVLRPQALVLLRVDEPLDLFRHPDVLVELERAQHPADHPLLVVGVHDLEAFGEPRVAPHGSAAAGARGRGTCRSISCASASRAAASIAVAHLGRGLVRERDREHVLCRNAVHADDPRDPVHEHARFAAARRRRARASAGPAR